ncbi:MAG: hypothetical protein HY302_15740 [Opitutae bacterium]|nr:hypothetical protein [Opitutae bacterium]
MKTFVIIFRQARSHPLSAADQQRRAAEMGPWIRQHNGAGHNLEPRLLAPESVRCGPAGSAGATPEDGPVTALLFLAAHDLRDAARVAESHPALRYGATAEVRAWAPPGPVAPPATPRPES